MKRGIAILLAALLLGLCACSPTGADASEPGGTQPGTQPATRGTETTAGTQQTQPSAQETDPTAETPEEPEINEAFTAAVPDAPEGALGVMFNEPLDGLELTVTQNGTDFGEYLTYNGRWGSPQKEYLMDTCWNAEAVLREAAGADEDWELYDSRLIQDDGIPYVCFRLEGETEQYALVPPDGSCVYAAELDPDTDRYCITGVF